MLIEAPFYGTDSAKVVDSQRVWDVSRELIERGKSRGGEFFVGSVARQTLGRVALDETNRYADLERPHAIALAGWSVTVDMSLKYEQPATIQAFGEGVTLAHTVDDLALQLVAQHPDAEVSDIVGGFEYVVDLASQHDKSIENFANGRIAEVV